MLICIWSVMNNFYYILLVKGFLNLLADFGIFLFSENIYSVLLFNHGLMLKGYFLLIKDACFIYVFYI